MTVVIAAFKASVYGSGGGVKAIREVRAREAAEQEAMEARAQADQSPGTASLLKFSRRIKCPNEKRYCISGE